MWRELGVVALIRFIVDGHQKDLLKLFALQICQAMQWFSWIYFENLVLSIKKNILEVFMFFPKYDWFDVVIVYNSVLL